MPYGLTMDKDCRLHNVPSINASFASQGGSRGSQLLAPLGERRWSWISDEGKVKVGDPTNCDRAKWSAVKAFV